jgi:hypothetical protein
MSYVDIVVANRRQTYGQVDGHEISFFKELG